MASARTHTHIGTVLIFSVNSNSKSSFLINFFFVCFTRNRHHISIELGSQHRCAWSVWVCYFSSNYRNCWHFSFFRFVKWNFIWSSQSSLSRSSFFSSSIHLQFNINSIARCYAGVAREIFFPFLRAFFSFSFFLSFATEIFRKPYEVTTKKKVFVFNLKLTNRHILRWLLLVCS